MGHRSLNTVAIALLVKNRSYLCESGHIYFVLTDLYYNVYVFIAALKRKKKMK